MQRMKQKANVGSRPFLGALALVIAFAAVGFFGVQQASVAAAPPQEPSVGATPQGAARTPPNEAEEAPNPNAPMTRAQGAAMLRELQAIRILLQNGAARPVGSARSLAPQPVKMRVDPSWYSLGRADAPVTMVEFMDLQCPFCRRFETTTFAELKKDYIDTGKVRFIALDLPLPMHEYALAAAEAARCAGGQGKFWQFRDAVLNDQVPPSPDVLLKHASDLGLNVQQFQSCLKDSEFNQSIRNDQAEAAVVGIHGTPGFVIGRVNGGWIDGLSMTGARPFPFFQQEIERILDDSSSAPAGTHSPTNGSAGPRPGMPGSGADE